MCVCEQSPCAVYACVVLLVKHWLKTNELPHFIESTIEIVTANVHVEGKTYYIVLSIHFYFPIHIKNNYSLISVWIWSNYDSKTQSTQSSWSAILIWIAFNRSSWSSLAKLFLIRAVEILFIKTTEEKGLFQILCNSNNNGTFLDIHQQSASNVDGSFDETGIPCQENSSPLSMCHSHWATNSRQANRQSSVQIH